MLAPLKDYLEFIYQDYAQWNKICADKAGYGTAESRDRIREDMTAKFKAELRYEVGRKFVKVIAGTSVHSFIVIKDSTGKFQTGDILKAASWNAPATNFKRGNIFDPDSLAQRVRWTGVS